VPTSTTRPAPLMGIVICRVSETTARSVVARSCPLFTRCTTVTTSQLRSATDPRRRSPTPSPCASGATPPSTRIAQWIACRGTISITTRLSARSLAIAWCSAGGPGSGQPLACRRTAARRPTSRTPATPDRMCTSRTPWGSSASWDTPWIALPRDRGPLSRRARRTARSRPRSSAWPCDVGQRRFRTGPAGSTC